jgi:hypothetical protein
MHHSVSNELTVKGRELPIVSRSQCQQIAVRYLRGIQEPRHVNSFVIHEGNAVRPKLVSCMSQKCCQQFRDCCGCAWGVGISCMSGDPQYAIRLRDMSPDLACQIFANHWCALDMH